MPIVLCTSLGNPFLKVIVPGTLKRHVCLRVPKLITITNYFP